jgi:two-component sensor histidine kinase
VRVRSRDLSPFSSALAPTLLVLFSGLSITAAATWATWLQARGLRRAREAEAEAREAHGQAELLLHEVNHRVANSLQLVASLVGLQAESVTEPAALRALADTRARILAVGRVHQRLYQAGHVEQVELCGYLRHLLEALAESLEGGARLRMGSCDNASVTPDKAVAVGVAVAELVTNAVKYAYPNGGAGEVTVSLRRADGRLAVSVEDRGVGWRPDEQAKGTGLGMKVVRAMAVNLAAEVTIQPAEPGTRAVLTFSAG